MSKLSFFDFLKSINGRYQDSNLLSECKAGEESLDPSSADKAYVPFMVNRGLSYFYDTALYANEMNQYANLPAKMQYDFLRTSVRPKKRFSKWSKAAKATNEVAAIMKIYNYSMEKAMDVLPLFSKDQLKTLLTKVDTGGKGKKK